VRPSPISTSPTRRITAPPRGNAVRQARRLGCTENALPLDCGGTTYAADTPIGCALPGLLAGVPQLEVLFEGGERVALQDFFWCGGRLVLSILDNLMPRYDGLTPSASGWERQRLGGLPETGVVSAWRFDVEEPESSGELLVNTQDPLSPPTLSLYTYCRRPPQVLREPWPMPKSVMTL
jgi:prolyl oligopeptidase